VLIKKDIKIEKWSINDENAMARKEADKKAKAAIL
jgi:hypothetical protein